MPSTPSRDPSPATHTAQEEPLRNRKEAHVYSTSSRCRPFISSGLWTYRPVLTAWLLLTPAGCTSQNLVMSQRERRGKESLDSGIQPSPPILSTLGSARPKAEGNSGSVMPAAECGAPQKSEERGEGCMFNEKHLKRKED